jgi:N-acetylmuramoyl-L-alanine amidase
VIDAGHGGVDPGAIGVSGAREKTIVLDYARELRRQLLASGRYRVVMTRNSDVTLALRTRVELGQQAEGDLFVSLHANIHRSRRVRGASVYTLSEKASDAEAEALAAKENKADVLSGVNLDGQSEDVSMILIDLAQRETMNLSKHLANVMVGQLGKSTRLLNNTHRFAGFAVLKSPTVPSVLVEVGYMSNRSEEKLLRSQAHRRKVAAAILRAIGDYFKWHDKVSRS